MIKGIAATLQQLTAQRKTQYTVKGYYIESLVEQGDTPLYNVAVVTTLEEAEAIKSQWEANEDYHEVYIDRG